MYHEPNPFLSIFGGVPRQLMINEIYRERKVLSVVRDEPNRTLITLFNLGRDFARSSSMTVIVGARIPAGKVKKKYDSKSHGNVGTENTPLSLSL